MLIDSNKKMHIKKVIDKYIGDCSIVEDYYGNSFLLGLENGLELTGGTIVTGAAAGDLTGFTLTFEGMEERAPYFLEVPVSGAAAQIDPTPAGVPAY